MGKRRVWYAAMQRLGSTWVISALGILVVAGLAALLVSNVSSARAAQRDARVAEAAATVTGDAIALFTALQTERGSAELLAAQQSAAAAARYGSATVRTDSAVQLLGDTWAVAREQLGAVGPPSIPDVLAAMEALGRLRVAAVEVDGESTFGAYVSIVDMLLATNQALSGVAANGRKAAEKDALTALLRATESLGRQRALVAGVLARGERLSSEETVRLSLLERDIRVNATAAQALLAEPLAGDVAAVLTGATAVQAEALLRSLRNVGEPAGFSADPLVWFEEASSRVDGLAAVAGEVNADLRRSAASEVRRARRNLIAGSVGLGSLLAVAVAAAVAAVVASQERVRALREYSELAGGLQEWFLPETLVDVEGLRFAARYLPSSERTRAGGDWYDSYLLGPRQVALVIGDVAGHGPQAGVQMAEVRNLLRGQCIAYPLPPAEQVQLLESTLGASPIFATMAFGVLDLEAGTFTYSRAGHVPPLLARPNGQIDVLAGGSGPPVGTGVVFPRSESRVDVTPGTVLVLYTDGLVESRRHAVDVGIAALVASVPDPSTDLEELADRVLASRPDTANEDDIAMLLVRWE